MFQECYMIIKIHIFDAFFVSKNNIYFYHDRKFNTSTFRKYSRFLKRSYKKRKSKIQTSNFSCKGNL